VTDARTGLGPCVQNGVRTDCSLSVAVCMQLCRILDITRSVPSGLHV
jgi:hypothetical protein